jgi:hypothetical protein
MMLTAIAGPDRALALAPLVILPAYRDMQIGTELVRHALHQAREQGWKSVFVYGQPDYYCRFGFKSQAADGADSPLQGPRFLALELQKARFLAGQALSTTRRLTSTVSGHRTEPERGRPAAELCNPIRQQKRRPAGRLIVYLVETRALPIRLPLPALSDDRDIPAPSAGPHHWRHPPRLRARPEAAWKIVAVDIGHGNSGLGQQRAAFRQNVGKTAKDHVAFGLAFRGHDSDHTGLDGGHGRRMMRHDRHLTVSAGNDDFRRGCRQEQPLRGYEFEIEAVSHDVHFIAVLFGSTARRSKCSSARAIS